jgi:hypothetical protein
MQIKSMVSSLVFSMTLGGLATSAFAEWSLTNKDAASYELTKTCGGKSEDTSVAGGVSNRKFSIPAGATSCTITVKKTNTSCTVKDGESCVIVSSKISKS